jgi:hypothetical protein
MAVIQLRRISRNGKAVKGAAAIPIGADTILCATLENADYIIPEGTYELKNTMSPKFKKVLPLVCGVRGRSGIRIHTGTKPEHSTGCVLVSAFGKQQIIDFINQKAKQNEKVYLTIATDL